MALIMDGDIPVGCDHCGKEFKGTETQEEIEYCRRCNCHKNTARAEELKKKIEFGKQSR